MAKRAAYRELGRFGVLVHPEGEMPDGDWEQIVHQMEAHVPTLRTLVIWADGTLTAKQRLNAQQLQKAGDIVTVMFTDAALTRGVIKVLHWFGVPIDVFSKAQFSRGLSSSGATQEEVALVRAAISDLERQLDWRVSSSNLAAGKGPGTRDPQG